MGAGAGADPESGTGEWAEVIELGPPASAGAPLPFVLASELRVALVYYAAEGPAGPDSPIGVITFDATAHRFGAPNDETLPGHRLWGRGLKYYDAHVVHDSSWLAETIAVAAVHERHDPADWADVRHYVLTFHDTTFECLASSYESALVDGPLAEVVERIAHKLVNWHRTALWE